MVDHVLEVGAPDPERDTSPIVGEEEELSLNVELKREACHFNGVAHRRICAQRQRPAPVRELDVWVRTGEIRPKAGAAYRGRSCG